MKNGLQNFAAVQSLAAILTFQVVVFQSQRALHRLLSAVKKKDGDSMTIKN
jgi:hypothetical protein